MRKLHEVRERGRLSLDIAIERRWADPRIASALSTEPVFAAGTRAASTGTVLWNTVRSSVSFIQRAWGGDVSMVIILRTLCASNL
jgi:hypothetical protein